MVTQNQNRGVKMKKQNESKNKAELSSIACNSIEAVFAILKQLNEPLSHELYTIHSQLHKIHEKFHTKYIEQLKGC